MSAALLPFSRTWLIYTFLKEFKIKAIDSKVLLSNSPPSAPLISIIASFESSSRSIPKEFNFLIDAGIEIYCAPTADAREVWQSSMTHIALEGGCFVLSANQFCRRKDYPPPPDYEFAGVEGEPSPDAVVCAGGSVIVSPSGAVLAGPNYEGEALISADLDLGEIVRAKFDFDVVGHYARPEVLSLTVKDDPQHPVFFASAAKRENEQKS